MNSAPNRAACHFFIVLVRCNQRGTGSVTERGLSPFHSNEVTDASIVFSWLTPPLKGWVDVAATKFGGVHNRKRLPQ